MLRLRLAGLGWTCYPVHCQGRGSGPGAERHDESLRSVLGSRWRFGESERPAEVVSRPFWKKGSAKQSNTS